MQTSSGIKNFVKEKVYGKGFFTLFPLIQSRESCPPTQGIELSASLQKKRNYDDFSDDKGNKKNSSISSKSKQETKEKSENNLFVPKRKKKKDSQLKEAVSAFNSALMNDKSTKELIFTCEEKMFVIKHECKTLQMQMQMNLQICQVLSQNMVVHPQQLQFLTP